MGDEKKRSSASCGCLILLLLIGVPAYFLAPSCSAFTHQASEAVDRAVSDGIENMKREDAARQKALASIDRSPAAQEKRDKFIGKAISDGYFYKFEIHDRLPIVWIRPRFRAIGIDEKKALLSVVFAYCVAADSAKKFGESGADGICLRDHSTGKNVGSYSPFSGLSLNAPD